MLTYSCLYLIVYVCIFICFFHICFCSIHSLNCNFLISGLFLNLLILFIYRPFIYQHISAIICIVLLINLSTIPVHRLSWKNKNLIAISCQWQCDANGTEGLIRIWDCMWFMCIVRMCHLYGGSCMNSFQIWQKWVDFIYEFTSDIKTVDPGGGGEHIYRYIYIHYLLSIHMT